MPPVAVHQPDIEDSSKRSFAKQVRLFANRAWELPGGRVTGAVAAAAVIFTTVSGAFQTGDMPLFHRTLFWSALIGFNTVAWRCWFAWRIRRPKDWWQAAALGTIVLNLPLPLEVALLSRTMGGQLASTWPAIWLYSGLLSVALVPVIAIGLPSPPAEASAFVKGHLWRAGARNPADVQAIIAEDHYCRVFLQGDRSTLIHSRFSDVVAELLNADGLIVRRGHWIAANAVSSINRQGRKWVVEAAGRKLSVAPSCVPHLRRSGWM